MRTKSAQNMRKLLNATGCYQLTGESSGDWELNAAGAELDLLSDEVDALVKDLFVQEASPACLDAWERSIRPQRSTAPTEQRQRMLRAHMAVCPLKGTLSDYDEMLRAAGVQGRLVEGENGLSVQCAAILGLTEAEVRSELDALLPAHLPWELAPVFHWLTMEACSRSFADWDALDLTWAELDGLTREELLEGRKNNGID